MPTSMDNPYLETIQLSGFLVMRSASIIAQVMIKRLILAQKDQQLLEVFGGLAALEDFIFMFSLTAVAYVSTITSQVHAETPADPKKIGALYRSALLLTGSVTLLSGALCMGAPYLYRMTKQPDIIIEHAQSYFAISFFAYFFDFFYRCLARVKIGLLQTRSPLIADLSEGFLDSLLTYFFVMKLELGVNGSALAYVIASAITFTCFSAYVFHDKQMQQYHLFQFSKELYQPLKMLKSGFYAGASASLEYLGQCLLTLYCGLSGPMALLGIQLAGNYSLCVTFLISGFLDAASIQVAKYYQLSDKLYRSLGHFTISAAAGYSCIFAVLFILFHDQLLGLFVVKNKLSDQDYQFLFRIVLIQALIEIANSVRNAGTDIFYACNKAQTAFVINTGFIFFLNSALQTASQFLYHERIDVTYAMQLPGFVLSTMCFLSAWFCMNKKIDTHRCLQFFKKPRRTVEPDVDLANSTTIIALDPIAASALTNQ